MAAEARAAASLSITATVEAMLEADDPKCLAGFLPIRTEFDPRPALERARSRGAVIALPAILAEGILVFRRYEPSDVLVAGSLGTRAPGPDAVVVDPDFIIVPLVAFDRAGTRIGYGKGYYDMALGSLRARGLRPRLVGVGFAVQEVESILREPHDVGLDCVVTENHTFTFPQESV